ncbi:LysE family translocator [Candidatus Pantoea multigeneris]|uniref:LysE family translocator n=1 Tax=Candidatus Pantoea multigeneris TaxID=2608357 RepID=A0ABX0RHB9_9GAMM|nr:LysE family translocator [Pantoea multigeneris]NIF23867.1 LysE family translocator [Pantoea multigeneris]
MDGVFYYFLLTVIIINLAPGPAMLYVLNQSVKFGIGKGLKAAAGVEAGVFFYVICVSFGLVVFFSHFPLVFQAIKIVGAVYLIWLAVTAWPKKSNKAMTTEEAKIDLDARHVFSKGLLINLTNPKIGLFFVSLLPQFIPAHASPAWLYLLAYGLVFNLGGIIVNSAVGMLGLKMKSLLNRAGWFDYVPPVLFVIIAAITIGKMFL